MAYRINHIHLKAPDPRKTAEWYVTALGFKVLSDEVRVFGDRFIKRLEGLGATLLDGPIEVPDGPRIAFLRAPDDVRIELITPRKQSASGGGTP
ncbi:MAG: VOC family protein [Candidatus Methylomirabilia bacterium]